MFLLWKLISQKNKFKNLIFVFSAFSITIIFLSMFGNFCGLQHLSLVNDLKTYEMSLDPEYCEVLVEKIDLFNIQCEPQIDILDCS